MIKDITKYDLTKDAVLLVEKGLHQIYWVGTTNTTALRNNIYLIKDRKEGIIVDCGSRGDFNETIKRVKQVMPLNFVTKLFVNHQDPDVTSGIIDWMELNPDIEVITSPTTNVLIEHYITSERKYKFINTQTSPTLKLPSGAILEFIPSPFMHSPGAVTIYDSFTKSLFSGDIWAAISMEWDLVLKSDFKTHIESMDFFHKGYIASNRASRNFLMNFKNREVNNILPQHGSIITKKDVKNAFNYIKNLKSGVDLMPTISDEELSFINNM